MCARTNHNLPKRGCHTLTTNAEENVCAHTARTKTNAAQAFSECRHCSRHRPFLNKKIQTISHYSAPPPRPPTPSPPPALQKAGERRERCPSRSRWLSLGYFSAALYPNINFPEIRRHYATAAGRGWGWGARTSPVYVPARGRCNQSSHLKVASPLARQGSKSLCNECPAHACRRRPAPRTARSPPGCRRPRAPGAGGEPGAGPGRQWAERLPCSCSRAGEQGGGEKERGPGAGPAALGLGLGPGSRAEARARLGRRVARGSAGAVAAPGDVC